MVLFNEKTKLHFVYVSVLTRIGRLHDSDSLRLLSVPPIVSVGKVTRNEGI